jgi:hypothetical protein
MLEGKIDTLSLYGNYYKFTLFLLFSLLEKNLCATDCVLIIFVALLAKKVILQLFLLSLYGNYYKFTTPICCKIKWKEETLAHFSRQRSPSLYMYAYFFFPFLNSFAYACISFLFLLI